MTGWTRKPSASNRPRRAAASSWGPTPAATQRAPSRSTPGPSVTTRPPPPRRAVSSAVRCPFDAEGSPVGEHQELVVGGHSDHRQYPRERSPPDRPAGGSDRTATPHSANWRRCPTSSPHPTNGEAARPPPRWPPPSSGLRWPRAGPPTPHPSPTEARASPPSSAAGPGLFGSTGRSATCAKPPGTCWTTASPRRSRWRWLPVWPWSVARSTTTRSGPARPAPVS